MLRGALFVGGARARRPHHHGHVLLRTTWELEPPTAARFCPTTLTRAARLSTSARRRKQKSSRFVDKVRITVTGGRGGAGSRSHHRTRADRKSPDGGDGGGGGNVVLRSNELVSSLSLDRAHFFAENGNSGGKQNMNGRRGKDLVLDVPVGTIVRLISLSKVGAEADDGEDDDEVFEYEAGSGGVYIEDLSFEGDDPWDDDDDDDDDNDDDGQQEEEEEQAVHAKSLLRGTHFADLDVHGSTAIVAHGGSGGRGSQWLKGKTQEAYGEAQEQYLREIVAGPAEVAELELELRLLGDIALVGFPNAGKSTLLRALSRATPEVAAYPFTTLSPWLGVCEWSDGYRLKVVDIPGLVDGAHRNRGLGHSFLRHVERTKALLFVLDLPGAKHTEGAADRDAEFMTGEGGNIGNIGNITGGDGDVDSLGENSIASHSRTAVSDLRALRTELELYLPGITSRPSIVAANKCDALGVDAGSESGSSAEEILWVSFSLEVGNQDQGMNDLIHPNPSSPTTPLTRQLLQRTA